MLAKNILYRGSSEAQPERMTLRAGPLEMLFEQGDLRAIRLGEWEVVRRVYATVRDRNWGTVPARLSNIQLRIEEDAFAIDYDVENQQGEIDFAWHGALRGTADGRVTFSLDGQARSTFEKNRIGFCVLFPASSAGQPVSIEHAAGTLEQAVFPLDISADQPVRPFENIRALKRLHAAGEVAVRLTGDIFEMEDQRLWTDASYKVFCTPLALPYPVQIQAGTRVSQQVELAAGGVGKSARPRLAARKDAPHPVELRLPTDADWNPLPLLGLGSASHDQPLSSGELERLKALHLHHLRVDLPLADPLAPQRLARAAGEAAALGIGLEIALLVSAGQADAELDAFRAALEAIRPPVCAWLVYPARERYAGGSPTEAVLRAARARLEDYARGVPFVAGTNTDFIFLKRTPPPTASMDRVCIALNPQVHAFDDLSLVETLEAQPMVVESARRLAGGLPVMVSPVTLKPRFNPYATGQVVIPPNALPPQVDSRQLSLFGAGWTLGSLRALLSGGVLSITYYETSGWRGVMEQPGGSPLPQVFPSLPGAVFPLYHVLADYGEFSGGQAVPLSGGEGMRASGLALRREGRVGILLANHTAGRLALRIDGLEGAWKARVLDETTAEQAMRSPEAYRLQEEDWVSPEVSLPPYGLLSLTLAAP